MELEDGRNNAKGLSEEQIPKYQLKQYEDELEDLIEDTGMYFNYEVKSFSDSGDHLYISNTKNIGAVFNVTITPEKIEKRVHTLTNRTTYQLIAKRTGKIRIEDDYIEVDV